MEAISWITVVVGVLGLAAVVKEQSRKKVKVRVPVKK